MLDLSEFRRRPCDPKRLTRNDSQRNLPVQENTKTQRKEREDKDHTLVCDFGRQEIEKKINILESKIDAQAKDQTKILIGDNELSDRLDRVEEKMKKLSLPN